MYTYVFLCVPLETIRPLRSSKFNEGKNSKVKKRKMSLPADHRVPRVSVRHSLAERCDWGALRGSSSGSRHKPPPTDGTEERNTLYSVPFRISHLLHSKTKDSKTGEITPRHNETDEHRNKWETYDRDYVLFFFVASAVLLDELKEMTWAEGWPNDTL